MGCLTTSHSMTPDSRVINHGFLLLWEYELEEEGSPGGGMNIELICVLEMNEGQCSESFVDV